MIDGAIGVFDSGLGGLAVASAVVRKMPQEDIVYLADFAHLPYGPRPLEEVRRYTLDAIRFLDNKHVKGILIACNTASAALSGVTKAQDGGIPVVGMIEPAVRAALGCSGLRRVGVVGTGGTIRSGEYERVFHRLAPGVEVFGNACPELLRLAEQGRITDRSRIRSLAKSCIAPLEARGIDALVLGCTDFTCVAEDVRAIVDPKIMIVDPAEEVVRTANAILQEKGLRRSGEQKGRLDFYATGEGPRRSREFALEVFHITIDAVTIVDLAT